MNTVIDNVIKVSPQQTLSVSQIQFLQLLALNNQDLERLLQKEYTENPMFEEAEPPENVYQHSLGWMSAARGTEGYDILSNTAAPSSLGISNHFKEQLNENDFTADQWKCVLFCLENIDNEGFLEFAPQEIAAYCGTDPAEAEQVIAALRVLEPSGCFVRDLSERLLVQLKEKDMGDEILERIIAESMEDVAAKRVTRLAAKYDISKETVLKYMDMIASLDPKPVFGMDSDDNTVVIPDVVCTHTDGKWNICLPRAASGYYRISTYYTTLFRKSDSKELKEYLAQKMLSAKTLLQNVEKREELMIKLTELLLSKQFRFFEQGGSLQPFTMMNAAQLLGVSPSTITRAVKNKWIQWPSGMMPMNKLFTVRASKESDANNEQIKLLIKEMIDSEDARKPLKDNEIAEMLKKHGIDIVRRTVAKYRSQLGIMSCSNRKLTYKK